MTSLLFIVILPALWYLLAPPVSLTLFGQVLYVAVAVALPALIAWPGRDRSGARGVLAFASLTLLLAATPVLIGVLISDVERMEAVPSPDGRLELVSEFVNTGIGGDVVVSVKGRLLPGILECDQLISIGDDVDTMTWLNDHTVQVDGQRYAVRPAVAVMGW